MKFYYNPTENAFIDPAEVSIKELCRSSVVTPGYSIKIWDKTLVCVGAKDDEYYFSFLEILDSCTVAEIDDRLRTLWGNTSIMPSHLWKEFHSWFIPSEYEVFGKNIYSKENKNKNALTLSYYNEKSYNRVKTNREGELRSWWERSPASSAAAHFCLVDTDGTADYYITSYTSGLAPVLVLKL